MRTTISPAAPVRRGFLRSPQAPLAAVSVVTTVLALAACSSGNPSRDAASSAPTTASSTTPTPSPSATYTFGYQPLWPFRTQAEAAAWQASYGSSGHQPWHLDAGQSALSFTRGFLGYGDIDRVTSTRISGPDAHVGVGFVTTGTHTSTAAVVHLVKYGPDAGAPWEVVGTDDTDFSLTTPRYGATVSSPVTIGGLLTGVDESIRAFVRQPSSSAAIGRFCCGPAGGEARPWQLQVAFAGATDPVLTIAVSTGGHIRDVERFAVTGVRHH